MQFVLGIIAGAVIMYAAIGSGKKIYMVPKKNHAMDGLSTSYKLTVNGSKDGYMEISCYKRGETIPLIMQAYYPKDFN